MRLDNLVLKVVSLRETSRVASVLGAASSSCRPRAVLYSDGLTEGPRLAATVASICGNEDESPYQGGYGCHHVRRLGRLGGGPPDRTKQLAGTIGEASRLREKESFPRVVNESRLSVRKATAMNLSLYRAGA